MAEKDHLVVFQDKKIRRTWFNDEWWFSVEDVVVALTDSKDPKQYINKMRRREESLSEGWVQIVHTLSIETAGGSQSMNCSNTEGIFRIIQSIPSKKAEPFKQWLAKVGYERVKEIENPELAQNRAEEYYKMKGYPQEWIDKRMRSIAVRQTLTSEWKQRGIEKEKEYAILTNEIAKGTFGLSVKEHKEFKNLDPKRKNQNLRDHMTDMELIFNMLGEATTTKIAQKEDSQGFSENETTAKRGGKAAGRAREQVEKEIGEKVVSKNNYVNVQKRKLMK